MPGIVGAAPGQAHRADIAKIWLWAISNLPGIGYSFQAQCLIVTHCYREADSVIRLISARRATPGEEEVYWSFR
jgi:hypothetical protein